MSGRRDQWSGAELVRPAKVSEGEGSRAWVKVVIVYDDIEPPEHAKHPQYGRCLGVLVQELTFPVDGEDLTWADVDETVVIAYPDPVVLAALDAARADPDGLGEAIHLDDYYALYAIYKADLVSGQYVVGREPYALIGGPSYEAP